MGALIVARACEELRDGPSKGPRGEGVDAPEGAEATAPFGGCPLRDRGA